MMETDDSTRTSNTNEGMNRMMKKLGFGLMRLPMIGEEVDMEQVKQMVDLFLERGFTYFDTAYGYIGGKSEKAVKTALVERHPRESFQLATKLPAWAAKSAEEARAMFQTSLERTGAGYFDYYLLHSLSGGRKQVFDEYGLWDFAAELKRQGLIRKLGFSFHDTADELEIILNDHPEVDFVQLQINYADWENDRIQSRLCYETARRHNKDIIIMEPVKGGSLSNLPAATAKPLLDYAPTASLSSWAIRYAASLEGVISVLSGMSTLAQMEDNTSFMQDFVPLCDKEYEAIEQVQQLLNQSDRIPCTDCRYCLKDCPAQVKIAPIFAAVNTYKVFNDLNGARSSYRMHTSKGGGADACIQCGQCESVCPQKLNIIELLKEAGDLLG